MAIKKKEPSIIFSSQKKQKGTIKTLGKIKELLTPREAWFQHGYHNVDESAFCLIGAAEKVDGPFEEAVKRVMVYKVKPVAAIPPVWGGIEGGPVFRFNDSKKTTHKKILNFLDSCIEFAGKIKVGKSKDENTIVL